GLSSPSVIDRAFFTTLMGLLTKNAPPAAPPMMMNSDHCISTAMWPWCMVYPNRILPKTTTSPTMTNTGISVGAAADDRQLGRPIAVSVDPEVSCTEDAK